MKKNYIPILLLGAILCSTCKAVQVQKSTSSDQIVQLRTGLLLVRLSTGLQKIETLKANKQAERAAREEKYIRMQNERIMKAFETHYDYSGVYFFDSQQAEQVREGNLENILRDYSGQMPASPVSDSVFYLVASFSQLQEPAGSAGIPALIIMDNHFQQLAAPFPFSVRTALYGEEERADRAVQLLNEQFHEYYIKSMKWRRKQEFKRAKKQFLEENRF